jgi:myosin-crossreactive antigen
MVSSDDDQQLLSASCVDHSSNGNNDSCGSIDSGDSNDSGDSGNVLAPDNDGLGDIDPFCHRIEMPTWMW